jgi:HK97 family phage major capsid protein/HK97 family phage prohead protease
MSAKLDINKLYSETHSREAPIERASIKDTDRTVELSFSSEEPVERWWGVEILDHSDSKACDLSRLKRGGALLMDHDARDQVGVVESCELDVKEKKCRAVVRFGKSARAQEIFQDVQDGIRKNVSVGYVIGKLVLEKEDDGVETYRATRWQPYEITLTSVPADINVGVGRNKNTQSESDNNMRILREAAPPAGGGGGGAPAPAANVQELTDRARTEARQAEQLRCREITSLGEAHQCRDLAQTFINDGKPLEEFRKAVLETRYNGGKPLVPATSNPGIGMNDEEARGFSIVKAIRDVATIGKLEGLEKEACEAVAKKVNRSVSGLGFILPWEVMAISAADRAVRAQRSLNATTATAGGFTVGTDVLGSSLIELLRNNMVFNQLGAQSLSGLQGNVAIPRHTGGATAYWLPEGGTVTRSQQTFGQLALAPKRLVAATAYDKQLLSQSSIGVESFVRGDLTQVIALKKDAACINGLGAAGEPLGILNATGVGTVTFGAAATWAKVVEFETTTATANALAGSVHYLTSPATKGKWKTAAKVSGQAIFLWEDFDMVNGYSAAATTQMPSGDKVIFGNFADFIIADWEGLDVVVDPYTLSLAGQISLVLTTHTDNGIRHAASFTVSTDSGAQ